MKIKGTNIFMIRGDTEVIKVSLKDTQGEIVDLVEGDKIYFTVKRSANMVDKEIQKIITEFADGKALIILEPEDTKNLTWNQVYVYDIQLTKSNGQVKTIVPYSRFYVQEEVTYE